MKLEQGSQQVTSGIPKELETASKALVRACHKVIFFKTTIGIFYAVGELASGCLSDIYLRYERTTRMVEKDKKADSGEMVEKVMVTIKCFGVMWLPMHGKPQLCIYEREVEDNINIVVAQCWSNILGAAAMVRMIDSKEGFNLEMARTLVASSKTIMPNRVFTKLSHSFEGEELAGMPPMNKSDVLGRFVRATESYVLHRIARYHIAFYFSLFRSSEAEIIIETEPMKFPEPTGKKLELPKAAQPPPEPPKNEERPVEETPESPALEPSPEPVATAPERPAGDGQTLEQRLTFKYSDCNSTAVLAVIKSCRDNNKEVTDEEVERAVELWVPHHRKYLEASKGKSKPKIVQEAEAGGAIQPGGANLPPRKLGMPRMAMPKAK